MSLFTLIPADRFLVFLGSAIVLNLTPGADVLFATACGLGGGPRAGAAAGLGTAIGSLWHAGLSAIGLSALLIAYPPALAALRGAGAAYLLWLAWQSWRAARRGPGAARAEALAPGAALRRAMTINATNPKVALFMLAFLPQFTSPARGPVWQQILLLGLTVTFTGGVITAAYGTVAGVLGTSLATRMSALNRIAAAMLCFLALRLLWG